MQAKELYKVVKDQQESQVKNMAIRIKNSKNPSNEITACIEEVVRDAYNRCVQEMECDKVLEYTIGVSLRVVNYSLLRQMGAVLAVVKEINKKNRSSCQYGDPYYKTYVVGLSKITVKVVIKHKLAIFDR